MFFASDNTGPVHPDVMQALARANDGFVMGYGADPIMERVRARVREIFEAPEAEVHLVATGTAANVILLGTLTQPFQTVFCAQGAHVTDSENTAPELFTGGAKLSLVPIVDGKMTPAALAARIADFAPGDIHNAMPGPVTITQVTEEGSVYSQAELCALTGIAKSHGLPVHMDGARFTNALVSLGCTPAEMTWKAGIDALSFGGTKNGLMGAEAMILFHPMTAGVPQGLALQYHRKRAAQLFSKHRYLSAQFDAYLAGTLWLDMARAANAKSARLRAAFLAAGHDIIGDPRANLFFAHLPRAEHARLRAAGAVYYIWGDPDRGDATEQLKGRFVTDWSISDAEIDRFITLLQAA